MKLYNSNKKQQFTNLLLGFLWVVMSLTEYCVGEVIDWHFYGKLLIGISYFILFYYEYRYKFIEITEDSIFRNSIPTLEIQATDLIEVKYFAGDYIFKSKNKRIEVVKKQINQIQLEAFENRFNLLKAKMEDHLRNTI